MSLSLFCTFQTYQLEGEQSSEKLHVLCLNKSYIIRYHINHFHGLVAGKSCLHS